VLHRNLEHRFECDRRAALIYRNLRRWTAPAELSQTRKYVAIRPKVVSLATLILRHDATLFVHRRKKDAGCSADQA
jgi:hypothetical protein